MNPNVNPIKINFDFQEGLAISILAFGEIIFSSLRESFSVLIIDEKIIRFNKNNKKN
jgi:hypothetical protein